MTAAWVRKHHRAATYTDAYETTLRLLKLCIIMLLVGSSARARRADSTDAKLFATIATLDGALFDAFNTCNVAGIRELLYEDLEFYHDYSG